MILTIMGVNRDDSVCIMGNDTTKTVCYLPTGTIHFPRVFPQAKLRSQIAVGSYKSVLEKRLNCFRGYSLDLIKDRDITTLRTELCNLLQEAGTTDEGSRSITFVSMRDMQSWIESNFHGAKQGITCSLSLIHNKLSASSVDIAFHEGDLNLPVPEEEFINNGPQFVRRESFIETDETVILYRLIELIKQDGVFAIK